MSNYSICLNMIVKDESHIIKETLQNICDNIPITYYVISDTGSTDNTIEIIEKFFKSKNIKGEIFNDEWKDFGTNRTLALQHAYKKSDFLFIFDADDKICGNLTIPNKLTHDAYYLKFGNTVSYKRMLLINNHLHWKYVGVLHEYIKLDENKDISEIDLKGSYYIDSGKTGSRNKDPNKYEKDAIILLGGGLNVLLYPMCGGLSVV